ALQRYRSSGHPWARYPAVPLTATKTLVEGLVPHFDADGDRAICSVTSNASTFVARNQTLAYHTAKAALRQVARFYAVKFGRQGIRENVVSPCTFVKPASAPLYGGRNPAQVARPRHPARRSAADPRDGGGALGVRRRP